LYSIYSYPNVILAFFGGLLVDRLGVRLGTITFCGLVLLGQSIFSIGVQIQSYGLMMTGRFVFGLGGESLTVAQNTFTARWFEGRVLALCFGIVVSFSRIGSAVNFAVTPVLTEKWTVPESVWFGTVTCGFSFAACIVGCILDRYGQARCKQVSADEKIKFRDIFSFKIPVWVIYFICVTFYIGILSFYTVASDIFQHTGYVYSDTQASFFLFLPNVVAIGACPTFGFLVDKVGRSPVWMMVASVMLILAHVAILLNAVLLDPLNQISPYPVMIWIGFAYAMGCSALWPMIAFVVEPSKMGTAYGMMTSLQNAGLAIAPTIIGVIQDANIRTSLHYSLPIGLFIISATVSFFLSFLLLLVDRKYTGGKLNATAIQRQLIVAQEAKEKVEKTGNTLSGGINENEPVDYNYRSESQPQAKLLAKTPLTVRSAYFARLGVRHEEGTLQIQ